MKIFLYLVLAVSLFAPFYTYALYPFILKIMTFFVRKNYKTDENYRPMVSVLIAAYNEEKVIGEKILNLSQLDYPKDKIEFLIGSDGSTDRTVDIAKSFADVQNLKVFDFERGGKNNVLNQLMKKAQGQVLVFSDANTFFDSKIILNLVKYFTDKKIGCVSGQLRYKIDESSGRGARAESAYWKYENWIKVLESKLGRLSGANGAVYAVRKSLVKPIREGIINDDFYTANSVLQSGYDVILETDAIAYEEPNDEFSSQFTRHVRDGAGHYQAIVVFWRMLFPGKGSFVHISHRVIRWLTPFFLIFAFLSNAVLIGKSPITDALFVIQLFGYIAMVIFYYRTKDPNNQRISDRSIVYKLANVIFYFFSVNLALLMGFIRLVRRQQKAVWETQR
jgi:cellulose synthase/poly-beta-1,6-N-acetylglucosamine synthase-like glycosyltransferase